MVSLDTDSFGQWTVGGPKSIRNKVPSWSARRFSWWTSLWQMLARRAFTSTWIRGRKRCAKVFFWFIHSEKDISKHCDVRRRSPFFFDETDRTAGPIFIWCAFRFNSSSICASSWFPAFPAVRFLMTRTHLEFWIFRSTYEYRLDDMVLDRTGRYLYKSLPAMFK